VKVVFLGTSGTFPTIGRNVTSHGVWVKGETLLLDCGEGTQRQLRRTSLRFFVHRIFLSHLHGDHILGLPGYIWSMDLLGRTEPLSLYIPARSRRMIEAMIGGIGKLGYPMSITELDDGMTVSLPGYQVIAARVEHSGHCCLGFRIEEESRLGKVDVDKARALGIPPGPNIGKLIRGESVEVNGVVVMPAQVVGPAREGRVVVYSGDTKPCTALKTLARGADLLLHESSFTNALADEAKSRAHSTAQGAASIAAEAMVKRLALTHISQRHQDEEGIRTLLLEARQVFPQSFLPYDLDEVELVLPE
jgi:ribonuclease Z